MGCIFTGAHQAYVVCWTSKNKYVHIEHIKFDALHFEELSLNARTFFWSYIFGVPLGTWGIVHMRSMWETMHVSGIRNMWCRWAVRSVWPREHEGTERDTEGVGWYVIDTKVIFSFRKSVFRDVRTNYNFDLRFLVKRQISMIMVDFSWGHIIIFCGDTRGLCSQGMQRTNKS